MRNRLIVVGVLIVAIVFGIKLLPGGIAYEHAGGYLDTYTGWYVYASPMFFWFIVLFIVLMLASWLYMAQYFYLHELGPKIEAKRDEKREKEELLEAARLAKTARLAAKIMESQSADEVDSIYEVRPTKMTRQPSSRAGEVIDG